MYFRNAVVHCRVVALSVSALQNGTKRFNSSQQMRILRLQSKSKVITLRNRSSTAAPGPHRCLGPRFAGTVLRTGQEHGPGSSL